MLVLRPFLRGAVFGCAFTIAACGGDEPQREVPPPIEVQVARELAAALYAKDDTAGARAAIATLVSKPEPATEDLIAAALVELRVADVAKAREMLERAEKQSKNDAAVHYNFGRLAELEGDMKKAAERFARALAVAPDDLPTKLHLADALRDDDAARAQKLLREVLALGVDHAGAWYMNALYKLSLQLLRDDATLDEGARLQDEWQTLKGRGVAGAEGPAYDMGNFGLIRRPPPRGNRPSGTGRSPEFAEALAILPEFAGAQHLLACDLDNDGVLDLVGYGPQGLVLALQREQFVPFALRLAPEPVDLALALDLGTEEDPGGDGDLDLVCMRGGDVRILEAHRTTESLLTWRELGLALPQLPSSATDALAVDYDHEGDLDLVFTGAFGALLWRNDGAGAPGGTFVDVTLDASVPRGRALDWCISEDFDTDQDVDFLFGGADELFLASNLRGGKFEERSEWIAGVPPSALAPLVADFDGDARPDLWTPAAGGQLWRGQPSAKLARVESFVTAPLPATSAAVDAFALDYDLDGALDVAWRGSTAKGEPHLAVRLVPAAGAAIALDTPLSADLRALRIADLDGDLAWDRVELTANGVSVRRGVRGENGALRLAFRGKKDNRRGVGAVVELRAGPIYRRTYWRGEAELLGVGEQKDIDYLRVTWPNGVVQYETRRELGDRVRVGDSIGLLQSDGLAGSCPFLYTWNGERYEFVTDVLGITPLGLPMAPGMLVPPDHDEYVLVRGEQLKPNDGVYELHFTEELREVTYLDRARLDVVDSPLGVEIYPNELFSFPPFPVAHTHTVREPLAPVRATGSDAKDWTAALARIDDEYAAPLEPLNSQMIGLAQPHWLEFEFERGAVAQAKKLRLLMTGWFFWTDASVNMAAGRHPEIKFQPPVLQVPDAAGGWRDTGPPIGFPAGKTKTMVVDVTELLQRDNPRLRLASTLRLYWDSIRLAVDDDDAELEVRSLEPASAKLWRRGFSAHTPADLPHQPERFDWHALEPFPRWNQHPGLYTKYGETLPLLTAIDDMFVILGAGDALTIRFDAKTLPPPKPGFKRDFLVFLDGWAKDRDPNTLEALNVEPLPFHGMSGYPYRVDEKFPDSPAHRAWRREWNTRPAHAWIEPVTSLR